MAKKPEKIKNLTLIVFSDMQFDQAIESGEDGNVGTMFDIMKNEFKVIADIIEKDKRVLANMLLHYVSRNESLTGPSARETTRKSSVKAKMLSRCALSQSIGNSDSRNSAEVASQLVFVEGLID